MRAILRVTFVIVAAAVWLLGSARLPDAAADDSTQKDAVSLVRTLLHAPPDQMDFGQIKLAIDKFVDPSLDSNTASAQIDTMAVILNKMIATLSPDQASTSLEKMKALRAFLYQPGKWNDGRPFEYDLTDPYGNKLGSKLLPTYLATRKGNCVSMPVLFLILGERIGLDVTLSTAPLHVFIKYTDPASGNTWNLETTSGAGFTRDAWYQQKLPMTQKAIDTGAYLKTLSRQQAIAVMATLILDDLIDTERYREAIGVADALLEVWPEDVYVLAKKGTAYYGLLQADIISKYPNEGDIPPDQRAYALSLYKANQAAFKRAEALGWTPLQ